MTLIKCGDILWFNSRLHHPFFIQRKLMRDVPSSIYDHGNPGICTTNHWSTILNCPIYCLFGMLLRSWWVFIPSIVYKIYQYFSTIMYELSAESWQCRFKANHNCSFYIIDIHNSIICSTGKIALPQIKPL